jgi:LuxR family maltose regulon positive regulatory protein
LNRAIRLLEEAGEQKYFTFVRVAVDGLAALMFAYQVNGQPEQAATTLQSLYELAHYVGPPFPALADSCAARLALMQGQMKPAVRWLQTNASPPAEVMLWWLEVPCVTRCRALIAEGSRVSLREAKEGLREYAEMNEAHDNTCQLIGILALLAMTCEKQGKRDQARAALEQALSLAQPGGFIFPFLELGPPMADLLKGLHKQNVSVDFIEKLLAAFGEDEQVGVEDVTEPQAALTLAATRQPLLDPLTNRELDILELLAQRLQNKEIAEKLFVSPETIRSHLKNIYQKLQVGNRREAVTKSTDLGILSHR